MATRRSAIRESRDQLPPGWSSARPRGLGRSDGPPSGQPFVTADPAPSDDKRGAPRSSGVPAVSSPRGGHPLPSRSRTRRLERADRFPGGRGGGRPLPSRSRRMGHVRTAPSVVAGRTGTNPATAGLAAEKSFPHRRLRRSSAGGPRRTGPIPARAEPATSKRRDRSHLPEWQSAADPAGWLLSSRSRPAARVSGARPPGAHPDRAKPTAAGAPAKKSLLQRNLRRIAVGGPRRTGPIPARVEPVPASGDRGRAVEVPITPGRVEGGRPDRSEPGSLLRVRPGGTARFDRSRGRIVDRSMVVVEQVVGRLVVGDPLGLGVPVEPGPGGQRDVGQVGEGRRAMAFLDVGVRPASGLDAVEEVAGVVRGRGRSPVAGA